MRSASLFSIATACAWRGGPDARLCCWLSPFSLAAAVAGAQPADLVLLNGRVYTLDASRPWAEGLAITGDRITAVGTTAEMRKRTGPRTRTVDLAGAFVSPGFNDAHVHMDATGALLAGVNLLDVHTEALLVERIRGTASRLPKGSWIVRGDWGAYEQWGAGSAGAAGAGRLRGALHARPPDDRRRQPRPSRLREPLRPLDVPGQQPRPEAGRHHGGDPAPPGGEIVKDTGGRPTGVLKGAAADLVRKVIPPVGVEERLTQVRAVPARGARGRRDHDAGPVLRGTGPGLPGAPAEGRADRAHQHPAAALPGRGPRDARLLARLRRRLAAPGGFKAWVDGIMGNSAALFFEPFRHDPRNRGSLRHVMFPEGQEGAAMT
jgi:predicted amidohydrolase YtcJ